MQPKTSDTKTLANGTLTIDLRTQDADSHGASAQCTCTISFEPGDNCPNSNDIAFVQYAQETVTRNGLELTRPEDVQLRPQATADGFYVDQVRSELATGINISNLLYTHRELGTLKASPEAIQFSEATLQALTDRRLHAYARTGFPQRVKVSTVIATLFADSFDDVAKGFSRVQAKTSVNAALLLRVRKWWIYMEGVREPKDADVTQAMATTIEKFPNLSDWHLQGTTGIDMSVWKEVRRRMGTPEQLAEYQPEIGKNAIGLKDGTQRAVATLFDAPQPGKVGKFTFHAAPYDFASRRFLGLVTWGFRTVMLNDELVIIPEPIEIAEPTSEFERLASDANDRFYAHWATRVADWQQRLPSFLMLVLNVTLRRRIERLMTVLQDWPANEKEHLVTWLAKKLKSGITSVPQYSSLSQKLDVLEMRFG